MSKYEPSIEERKRKLLDEMMSAGAGGFSAAAPAEGPVAGFDTVMGAPIDRAIKKVRKKKDKKDVKEEYCGGETDRRTGKLKEDVFSEDEIAELVEKLDGKSAKDKDYSLHDWFKGGGWKQTGGKYDGKPCAKQPGQKTKPFCRDADDRANMSKDEKERRSAKKRKEDPNPDREGKAKMVSEEGKKDACYHKVKASAKVWPSAYASGRLVQCRKKGASNYGNSKKKTED